MYPSVVFLLGGKRTESYRHLELIIMKLTATTKPKNFSTPENSRSQTRPSGEEGEAEVPCTTSRALSPRPQVYLLTFVCAGSSRLRWRRSSCGGEASHCSGVSQLWTLELRLWRLGFVTPQHVGSSRTRDQTHACCIVRRIPYH